MLIEAYVQKKINKYTYQCLVAIDKNKTREQLFTFYPLKKIKENSFSLEDMLNHAIYIWRNPTSKQETIYYGKIIFIKEHTIFVVNQVIEEIYKRIE